MAAVQGAALQICLEPVHHNLCLRVLNFAMGRSSLQFREHQRSEEGYQDDQEEEGDDGAGDGKATGSFEEANHREDGAKEPEDKVEDGYPAQHDGDEGDNETGGAESILFGSLLHDNLGCGLLVAVLVVRIHRM